MSVNEKMTAIADKIREFTIGENKLSLDEMPTEIDRVHQIGFENGVAKGESDGYQAGYTEGEKVGIAAGKEAERQTFWNTYQNRGNRILWQYAFYDWLWQDANYKPIYDIEATNVNNMYTSSYITDTKVSIDISGVSNAYYMFYNCVYLKTIRKLIVSDSVTFESTFYNCKVLQSITIEGTIGASLNLKWSPLNKESIESVINALSDDVTGKTVTFKQTAKELAFTDEEWATLVATKPNWTISLI